MEFAIIGVVFILLVAVLLLRDSNADLRSRFGMASKDAERWKKEANKRGWKNPFEEITDSLSASAEKLKAVAAAMRHTTEIRRRTTEQIKAVNTNLEKANAAMVAANERLEKARASFVPDLPVPERKLLPEPIEDRMVREVIRRHEADVAAGRMEIDPTKKN